MIKEVKAEIAFLKSHNLDQQLWKENSIELIKRLTSDIHVKNQAQRKKLLEEVRDFVAKGKGNDDSFDFTMQEDKKFFKEVHVYHHKDKVVARIDRTINNDKTGKHKPFENFITIEYSEDNEDRLTPEHISILGIKYVLFPANLIFAEHLFAHMAGDIVKGVNHKKSHYDEMTEKAIAEIPDIFATPEQKERDKELAEIARYKIWDKAITGQSGEKLGKETLRKNILLNNLALTLSDLEVESIETAGMTEEDIFRNLMFKVSANTEEENQKLKRQAKEFFDPEYGDDSFDMSKKIENGTLLYEVERNRKDNQIRASVSFDKKNPGPRKIKHEHMLDIIHMTYEEDPENPGEFVLQKMLILGKPYPVGKQWEWLGARFYSYLQMELNTTDSNIIDMGNINEVLDIIDDRMQSVRQVDNKMLAKHGVLTHNSKEIDQNEEARIKKKYEQLYGPTLTYS